MSNMVTLSMGGEFLVWDWGGGVKGGGLPLTLPLPVFLHPAVWLLPESAAKKQVSMC